MQACSPDCICNEDQPEEEDDDEPSKHSVAQLPDICLMSSIKTAKNVWTKFKIKKTSMWRYCWQSDILTINREQIWYIILVALSMTLIMFMTFVLFYNMLL